MKKLKKITVLLLALILVSAMTSCAKKQEEQHIHKIGVVVYDLKDEQVQAFREYLEGYIGKNFSDVDFLYSAEVTTEEQEMQFLNDAIAAGVEGIMAFNSFDLEKEVELCAENGVYFIRPSSTTDPETFDKVANNPYFLGYFGPGSEIEYEAGYDSGRQDGLTEGELRKAKETAAELAKLGMASTQIADVLKTEETVIFQWLEECAK